MAMMTPRDATLIATATDNKVKINLRLDTEKKRRNNHLIDSLTDHSNMKVNSSLVLRPSTPLASKCEVGGKACEQAYQVSRVRRKGRVTILLEMFGFSL